jgi:hypothetical protein
MHEADEFWEELLAQIEMGQVIPVVGPELLTVVADGGERRLYQLLAQRLLEKYALGVQSAGTQGNSASSSDTVAVRPYHELNDAVSALIQRGRRVQDLYRPINELLRALVEDQADHTLEPLRHLASVRGFKLFVTATPDDLLARAIDAERHGGQSRTGQIVFAPKLASGGDLPVVRPSEYTAVCYLFGKASATPFVFAIHDEDILEFVHKLQVDNSDGKTVWLSELRTQNLLLIGCNFADWLSRFFIRLWNTQRLADPRNKREFLIDQSPDTAGGLTVFLEQFSPNTWVFPGSAREFAAELARRWKGKHPPSASPPAQDGAAVRLRSPTSESIFISYSRTDLPAAAKLFEDMQEIGADVIWFDKHELRPGDLWELGIKTAIEACWLFLPLLSATTEARSEGGFRKEWNLANDRALGIQGRKFIIPIVVDKEYGDDIRRYQLVPDRFKCAQYGHAPEGVMSDALRSELISLIRERRAQGSS